VFFFFLVMTVNYNIRIYKRIDEDNKITKKVLTLLPNPAKIHCFNKYYNY